MNSGPTAVPTDGKDLVVGDRIAFLGNTYQIDRLDPYTGILDFPAGTRVAVSLRAAGKPWEMTVFPDESVQTLPRP